jgi:tRNA1(Val) A37 N6-methylase TrmN6
MPTTLPDIDEPVSLDRLCGDWFIHQLVKGHRFSTDDMVCAYEAARVRPGTLRALDLGAGIGSVGLMTLYRLGPDAHLTMVEAQEISHRLARHTIRHNGLEHRITARHGDLRDPGSVPEAEHGTYGIVTGSPPYIPLGKGVVSPHPQRAACRMELRGDVFDYCATAARALAPDGIFSLVHSAVDPRPEEALAAAGLTLRGRRDVYFRRNRAPTIAVWIAGFGGQRADPRPLVIREADGAFTQDYVDLRAAMGAPVPAAGAPRVS